MNKVSISEKKKSNNITLRMLGYGMFFWAASKVYKYLSKTNLSGHVVLITGGSRGLGLAIARELGSKGARLALCARNTDQLDKARYELETAGVDVMTVTTDITDESQVNSMVQQVIQKYGRIDMLINNAGVMMVGPENVMGIDDYKKVMDTNLWASLYAIKAVLPFFKKQKAGHIVNICSIGGKVAVPHMLPYSVSKFALTGLSQGLSVELSKQNIKVFTVIPNLMRTGSPRNVTVKGNHEAEYAWFKLSDSLPFLSQSASKAARRIVQGIASGETEIILTLTAKIASAVQALAPGAVRAAATVANHFLPDSNDTRVQSGSESESPITQGAIGAISDVAARENNEL